MDKHALIRPHFDVVVKDHQRNLAVLKRHADIKRGERGKGGLIDEFPLFFKGGVRAYLNTGCTGKVITLL
ncbi:MAG TPA: hypothetical protein EYP59_07900 [Thiotrichaceae bacterium]|nr:hypothetical protein [Thiotrichaceae bacterium]